MPPQAISKPKIKDFQAFFLITMITHISQVQSRSKTELSSKQEK